MSEPPVDSWADPVAAADAAATSLLTRIDRGADLGPSLASLRRRTNEALVLALAEAGSATPARGAVADFRAGLRDWSWLHRLAIDNAGADHLGIVSLGLFTRRFLESVADVASQLPEIRTHSRAVARGIGYLGLPTTLGDPADGNPLVIPAMARHRDRIWTTTRAAEAVRGAQAAGRAVVVLCHPAATLSQSTRLAYRPDPILIDVKLTTGVTT